MAVVLPNRSYRPEDVIRAIELNRRRVFPFRPVGASIYTTLKRLADSGRLNRSPAGGYSLPLNPPKPKAKPRKKKKAKLPRPSTTPGKVALKPPSVLYRARRMGLAPA